MLQEILFTDVLNVEYIELRQIELVKIVMPKDKILSFYADSYDSTMQWFNFCGLLSKIPNYGIPEIPKENIALQQGIDQYSNSRKCDDTGNIMHIYS